MIKFPDGSVTNTDRLSAAAIRALDAHMAVERHADRLIEELDQITSPGVVRTQITDEDSLVIAISALTSSSRS